MSLFGPASAYRSCVCRRPWPYGYSVGIRFRWLELRRHERLLLKARGIQFHANIVPDDGTPTNDPISLHVTIGDAQATRRLFSWRLVNGRHGNDSPNVHTALDSFPSAFFRFTDYLTRGPRVIRGLHSNKPDSNRGVHVGERSRVRTALRACRLRPMRRGHDRCHEWLRP